MQNENYATLTTEIVENNIVFISVTKDETTSLDFDRIDYVVDYLTKMGKAGENKLVIAFDYNDDPREISEIPEVRLYARKVYEKHYNIFFFMPKELTPVAGLLACLSNDYNVTPCGTQLTFSRAAIKLLDDEIIDYAHSINVKNPSLISDIFK